MTFLSHLCRFIYPSVCIHCEAILPSTSLVFCSDCLKQIEMADCTNRCPICFAPDLPEEVAICRDCESRNDSSLIDRRAFVFEYTGPIVSWIRKVQLGALSHLLQGGGAWLTAQMIYLKWPIPDLIVPIPQPKPFSFLSGGSVVECLAESVATLLSRPCDPLLKRNFFFSYKESDSKEKECSRLFELSDRYAIEDLVILLVGSVQTTGEILEECGKALAKGFPSDIYALHLTNGCTWNR